MMERNSKQNPKQKGNLHRPKNRKMCKKNKKNKWRLAVLFIIYEIIFSIIISPFILFYGPFQNAKSRFVGTAMGSMHFNFLATTFLSQDEINKILGKTDQSDDQNSDDSLVNVPTKSDNTIKYEVLEGNKSFIGHVLTVSNPRRIHIGYTSKLNDANKAGETTSQIALNNGAEAAVNGGAFTDESNSSLWSANGGTPSGVIIRDGKTVYDDTAGAKSGTIAMANGKLLIGKYTTKQLLQAGATEAVGYKTTLLVSGGSMTPMSGDGGDGSSPRTLIGQKKDGSILLVVLDARIESMREAATLKEAQEVMYKLQCVTAGTLDGGKSATMFFKDDVVNNPSYAYGERSIPTAIIVK